MYKQILQVIGKRLSEVAEETSNTNFAEIVKYLSNDELRLFATRLEEGGGGWNVEMESAWERATKAAEAAREEGNTDV